MARCFFFRTIRARYIGRPVKCRTRYPRASPRFSRGDLDQFLRWSRLGRGPTITPLSCGDHPFRIPTSPSLSFRKSNPSFADTWHLSRNHAIKTPAPPCGIVSSNIFGAWFSRRLRTASFQIPPGTGRGMKPLRRRPVFWAPNSRNAPRLVFFRFSAKNPKRRRQLSVNPRFTPLLSHPCFGPFSPSDTRTAFRRRGGGFSSPSNRASRRPFWDRAKIRSAGVARYRPSSMKKGAVL